MAPQVRRLLLSPWALFAVFVLTVSSASSSSLNPPPSKRVALFVFGDSLFDPGNNMYLNYSGPASALGTIWPYGETFFKHPTGRISDGRVVPDFIAEFFKLPIWKAYLAPGAHNLTDGANFASGGAGVLPGNHPGTISLDSQLSYFKEVVSSLKKQIGGEQTKKLLNSAVYLISMGGNDYFGHYNTYPNASASSLKEFVGIVTRNLTGFLEEVYNLGGRKIAFQNVGALGCVPKNLAESADGKTCLDKLSAMARLHNYKLSKSLEDLEKRLPGFKYSIFDYYHTLQDRVLHATKYGFENGTGQCYNGGFGAPGAKAGKATVCKDPSKYVFFDGGHTTEACNWQLAKLMWKGKKDVVRPCNFKQLYEL